VTLQIVLRSDAGDTFLLEDPATSTSYLYDRLAQTVVDVAEPATLVGRGAWRDFDGDAEKILGEARALRPDIEIK
jgi:hypothetical protein